MPGKQKSRTIRELFLVDFVKEVIKHYPLDPNFTPEPTTIIKPEPQIQPSIQMPSYQAPITPINAQALESIPGPKPIVKQQMALGVTPIKQNKDLQPSMMAVPSPSAPHIARPRRKLRVRKPSRSTKRAITLPKSHPSMTEVGGPIQRPNIPTYEVSNQPISPQYLQEIGLSRFSFLISDPAVLSAECTGPGHPILVNKSGSIQATNIVLSKSEINHIVDLVSKKTKVPVISGMFKAALQNFIFTAVNSEHAGSSFVIQKKRPY
tara:strand:+ start:5020 stop:5811 length:792 start_codon:yes stop_codon:yes gene_type:complete